MSRWRSFTSNRLAATLALVVTSLGATTGCEVIASVDRSTIDPAGSGGGGTGGAGTGGMMAGSGGSGGTPECSEADDCAGTDTVCVTRTCEMGACGVEYAPVGTPDDTQVAGDCKVAVCDGEGVVTNQDDNDDVLDDGNDCTLDECDAGDPKHTPLVAGTACSSNGGSMCDGEGACVECIAPSDCESGVCVQNQCAPAECSDAVKNGEETDVDCGGSACAPCADGLACGVGTDCESGVCAADVCEAPTCGDGVKNGEETDVDCGGPTCAPCGPMLGCTLDTDCVGGQCSGSVCVPTCTDGEKNANETDVDCGGPTCAPCVDDQTCGVDSDCASHVCAGGTCAAPTCSDGTMNGDETGIDCGGATCGPCGDGLACTVPADCQSGVCTADVCQAPTCTDTVKNGAETDIDCGGGSCVGCELNQACLVGTDCVSNICAGGVCVASLCGDSIITGDETCDDGNTTGNDGCSATCALETGWNCTGAPSVCMAICGDGLIRGAENCDDGNNNADDGCSATCTVEPGFACTGTPSVCVRVEAEPNNACGTANGPLLPPFTIRGAISPIGDHDYYAFTVPAYADVRIETFGATVGACPSAVDTVIQFRGEDCSTVLIEKDQGGLGNCSRIDPTLAADAAARGVAPGTYYVRVEDYQNNSTIPAYHLQVSFVALCGDGVVEGSEECDEGGPTPTCQVDCQRVPICGDGHVDGDEQCDDGGPTATCDADCQRVPVCGDGFIDGTEQCDDGNTNDGDCCSSACQLEAGCEVEPNDTDATANVWADVSVNNIVKGFNDPALDKDVFAIDVPAGSTGILKAEVLDGPIGPACSSNQIDSYLTIRNASGVVLGEDEDSGAGYCSMLTLSGLVPGTYYVEHKRTTNGPFGLATYNYTLELTLSLATCGNGAVEMGEGCDDGDTNPGDGCSATCTVETGFQCIGSPSVCTPSCGDGVVNGGDQCDDGNTDPGDGCSASCAIEADYHCAGQPSVCSLYESNCNDGIDNDGDGDVDIADGDCQIPAYFPACEAGETLRVYKSSEVPKPIPDNDVVGTTSRVFVANNIGTIARAAVLYTIPHTYASDVDIYLTPPGGAQLDICTDNGAAGQNYTNTVLDSTCATNVTAGSSPFSGCYRPETSFASLSGQSAQGVWTLWVADDYEDDTGTLESWGMIFCIAP